MNDSSPENVNTLSPMVSNPSPVKIIRFNYSQYIKALSSMHFTELGTTNSFNFTDVRKILLMTSKPFPSRSVSRFVAPRFPTDRGDKRGTCQNKDAPPAYKLRKCISFPTSNESNSRRPDI